MTEERAARLNLIASVDEAQIQRSIKRFRELHAAEKDVTAAQKQMDAANKQSASAILPLSSAQQRYIDNLKLRATLAQKEIQLSQQQARVIDQESKSRERAARATKSQTDASAADVRRKQTTALAGATSALGGLESLAGAGPAGNVFRAISAIARLQTQIEQLAPATEAAGASAGKAAGGMAGLGGSLAGLAAAGVAAVALAAMSIVIQKFIEDLNRQQKALTQAVDANVKYHELVIAGSAEEIEAERMRLDVKRQAIEITIREMETGLAAAEAVGGFEGAIASLLNFLGVTSGDVKRLKEDLTGVNTELRAYENALKSDAVQQRAAQQTIQNLAKATKSSTTVIDEAKRKEEERTRAIKQAAQDIEQARMREAQAEAAASQKRIERMADIARQFAQSTADALREMQEDQAELVIKFGQEQADALLESQRDEERAAREHSRAIKSIRDKAALDEFNAIRDRDFARLVEIRRGVEQEVDEESSRFAAEREEANIALRQRLQDAHVAYQRERAARLTEYNNQLIELRINKSRQQAEARIAYNRELANLRQSLQNEIALKQQALQATLDMTRRWAGQIVRAVGGNSTGYTTGASTSGGGSAGFAARAFGGPLVAGQTSLVNELGRERWMSGGRSTMLPSGVGLFTPLRGGTVQAAGGPTVNMAVYAAPGMSEERVAQIAVSKIHQKFRELAS